MTDGRRKKRGSRKWNEAVFLFSFALFFVPLLGQTGKALAKDAYVQKVICRLDPHKFSFDKVEDLYSAYDVDGNENIYYVDRKSRCLKIFDSSGKLNDRIPLDQKFCKDFSSIFARDGFVLLYSAIKTYLLDLKDKKIRSVNIFDWPQQAKFVDGVLYDVKTGKIFYSTGNGVAQEKLVFYDKYFSDKSYLSSKDGRKHSGEQGGFGFWNLKTVDEFGDVFANYYLPKYKESGDLDSATKFEIIKFNKDLEVQYVWKDSDYHVNEKTSNVYQIQVLKDGSLQLVGWIRQN